MRILQSKFQTMEEVKYNNKLYLIDSRIYNPDTKEWEYRLFNKKEKIENPIPEDKIFKSNDTSN